MTLLERLKSETGPAHERIEREIRLPERLRWREAYAGLLKRFYGFHAIWEAEVQRGLADPGFFDRRRKTHLLVRDLRALGMEDAAIERLPLCRPVPLMPTRATVLGLMYVVEGSTLSRPAQPAPRMPPDQPRSIQVARANHLWDSQRKSA